MTEVTVAATQFACETSIERNVAKAEEIVRRAASRGAQIIVLQELFETHYFCKDERKAMFALARPVDDHPTIARMQELAQSLKVVLPVSFFERANNAYYNSLVMIDADGEIMGLYRKSHIPDGVGYEEKFYFNPGDTGFRVWDTMYGRIGAGICWDQWFPECARSMVLQGAEILIYPTAIGSEPLDPKYSSAEHWQRVMQGHAGANMVPLVASNRIGSEIGESCSLTFYGRSFIADQLGAIVAEAGDEEAILLAKFDLDVIRTQRAGWGLFRDRRPELYTTLMTLDGQNWTE
ncbi:N-carbamoylputrescine amidase [Dongia soli]|uniref:N-carbamoylputrescine amidase n=1 Tax=Dongia soli TaxID=600628 RepID=A0ABU5EBV9_9PROT|nr:N-carbamoylputrescine amidase [Dongia soli]MDY0883269.1 N-carbamoylputrescine amidase [Dongia soli]